MIIIGIDYSTDLKKCGLSTAEYINNKCQLNSIGLYKHEVIAELFRRHDSILISIDAPLGWPEKLSNVLFTHKAGFKIQEDANELFRRLTDVEVKRITGKQSLDVGADKIARTAHGALNLISRMREMFGIELPLAWNPGALSRENGASVIEVYPAVTLKQNNIRFDQYKGPDHTNERREIIESMSKIISMDESHIKSCLSDDNILDSVVCVLAGIDFINGSCHEPGSNQMDQAEKEGWIWFKNI